MSVGGYTIFVCLFETEIALCEGGSTSTVEAPCVSQAGPTVEELTALVAKLIRSSPAVGDAERIDRIVLLDMVQAAVAAASNVEITAFSDSQVEQQRAAGISSRRFGQGIAEQIALARKVSPVTGARHITRARTLTEELPETQQLLAEGQISDWVASIVVRKTTSLLPADKASADAELAEKLPTLSPRQAEAATRRLAYRLDPKSAMRRSRTSRADRRVSIRPAPDTMALRSGYLPVEQGVAAWANLDRHAKSLRSQGDPRSLGQIMADTLVERLTGQPTADATPLEVSLVMTAGALMAGEDTPARLDGLGPLPGGLARQLATHPDADVFVGRIFTDPHTQTVTSVDNGRRRFTRAAKRFIRARDQHCRMAYCTAATTPHATNITTSTGHTYQSQAPPALGP